MHSVDQLRARADVELSADAREVQLDGTGKKTLPAIVVAETRQRDPSF